MLKRYTFLVISLAIMFSFTSCDVESPYVGEDYTKITFSFSELQPLTDGFYYEAWAVAMSGRETIGKFNINEQGNLVDLNGNLIPDNTLEPGFEFSLAVSIQLTIENDTDSSSLPSKTVLLSGEILGKTVLMNYSNSEASFTDISGTYQLATPTTASEDDEFSGVWFMYIEDDDHLPTLTLPIAPLGWKYETWVDIDGTQISLGKFTNIELTDESEIFHGPERSPSKPGGDMIQNPPAGITFPVDLRGQRVFITFEPFPDNDEDTPFFIVLMENDIAIDAEAKTQYVIDKNAVFPTGFAQLKN